MSEDVSPLLVELGYFCVQQGLTAEAQSLLRGAQVLRPKDPAPGLFLGMSHFASGGYAEAERTYRRVLETHDDDLTRAFLAETLIAQKRWAESKTLLEEVVKRWGRENKLESKRGMNLLIVRGKNTKGRVWPSVTQQREMQP